PFGEALRGLSFLPDEWRCRSPAGRARRPAADRSPVGGLLTAVSWRAPILGGSTASSSGCVRRALRALLAVRVGAGHDLARSRAEPRRNRPALLLLVVLGLRLLLLLGGSHLTFRHGVLPLLRGERRRHPTATWRREATVAIRLEKWLDARN